MFDKIRRGSCQALDLCVLGGFKSWFQFQCS